MTDQRKSKAGRKPKLKTGEERFDVVLQARHSEFVRRKAEQEGRTPEQMIERFIRIAYAADPYKGGKIEAQTENGYYGPARDFDAG